MATWLQSDHVIFADEITADDEKFSPQHDDIPDDMIEGILSRFPLLLFFNTLYKQWLPSDMDVLFNLSFLALYQGKALLSNASKWPLSQSS